ncbi:mavicyanin-like [Impatiens glandulifera]|uniref:mavicyanin-like n=1 Tax=Impatiens glandulifera TaxID=253017 RepID=UPI001FB1640F|nr:mavicyanin-like [Impatiens glandulifera]
MGAIYNVGDSVGWTNNGSFNYKSWSSTKTFQVGDTIVFEYKPQFDNVVRVTHKNFNSCNSTAGYYNLSSGADSITIMKPGHFFFISGFPGHCLSGQKVDIRVGSGLQPTSPAQSPAPSPHYKNAAISISSSSCLFFFLVFLASTFVY